MDSDDYFEDELDSEFFDELDAIEAAHLSSTRSQATVNIPPARPQTHVVNNSQDDYAETSEYWYSDSEYSESSKSSEFELSDYSESDLDELVAPEIVQPPVAGPSKSPSHQQTLCGVNPPPEPPNLPPKTSEQETSTPHNQFACKAPKTKRWQPISDTNGKDKVIEQLPIQLDVGEHTILLDLSAH